MPEKEAEAKVSREGEWQERLSERMVGGKENIDADFEEFILRQPSISIWLTCKQ